MIVSQQHVYSKSEQHRLSLRPWLLKITRISTTWTRCRRLTKRLSTSACAMFKTAAKNTHMCSNTAHLLRVREKGNITRVGLLFSVGPISFAVSHNTLAMTRRASASKHCFYGGFSNRTQAITPLKLRLSASAQRRNFKYMH
jgi:hypothetical protein